MKKSIFATIATPVLCAALNPVFADTTTNAAKTTATAITDSEIASLTSGYLGYAGTSEPRRSELTAHAQEAENGQRGSLAEKESHAAEKQVLAMDITESSDPSSVLF